MQAVGARRSAPKAAHVCPGVVVAWVGARVLPILRGGAEERVVPLRRMPSAQDPLCPWPAPDHIGSGV